MRELAKPAMEAVASGKIKFHPERWTKVYMHWMENIRDWCISRQIWWGHRIPAWHNNATGAVHVGLEAPTEGGPWRQDEDVLDTWFSSWLWPFSIMGWPDKTEEQDYFYPTADLVTGPDIIFFWVARMIMAGLEFKGEVPVQERLFHQHHPRRPGTQAQQVAWGILPTRWRSSPATGRTRCASPSSTSLRWVWISATAMRNASLAETSPTSFGTPAASARCRGP